MCKIALAADRFGYHARGLIAHRLTEQVPEVKLGFVLIKQNREYYKTFTDKIVRAAIHTTSV